MTTIYTWWGLAMALLIVLYFEWYFVRNMEEEVEECEKNPDCELIETLNNGGMKNDNDIQG